MHFSLFLQKILKNNGFAYKVDFARLLFATNYTNNTN